MILVEDGTEATAQKPFIPTAHPRELEYRGTHLGYSVLGSSPYLVKCYPDFT